MSKEVETKKFSETEAVVAPNTDEIANDIDAIEDSVKELKDEVVTSSFAKFSEGVESVCEECTKENLENVKQLADQLSEKVSEIEKSAKFSLRRKARFCGQKIKAFTETVEDALNAISAQEAKPEVIDNSPGDIDSDETVSVPATFAEDAPEAQELEKANEELAEALEEADDPAVVLFGRKLQKVTKKAFSRRDARAKCALAKMFSEVAATDSDEDVKVDESKEVDTLVEEIKDKEDKIDDATVVEFSKALRRIMKNTKSFTKADLNAKVKILKVFSEALDDINEPEKKEEPAEPEKKGFTDKDGTPAEAPTETAEVVETTDAAPEVVVEETEDPEVLPESIANFSSKENSSYGQMISSLSR